LQGNRFPNFLKGFNRHPTFMLSNFVFLGLLVGLIYALCQFGASSMVAGKAISVIRDEKAISLPYPKSTLKRCQAARTFPRRLTPFYVPDIPSRIGLSSDGATRSPGLVTRCVTG
jgi:hypothetical protein